MSYKKVREFLVESYFADEIDDEEFCILYDANHSKNPEFPYEDFGRFELEELSEAECQAEFRFKKEDIQVLAGALGIPQTFVCEQGSFCDGIEGLCLLLRRFAYPCRYSDLIPRFGRPVPVLSMISSTILDFIFDNHSHRLMEWNNTILSPRSLQIYANKIHDKGSALENCFGFVDGTVR